MFISRHILKYFSEYYSSLSEWEIKYAETSEPVNNSSIVFKWSQETPSIF
jgi:hypothetical protein